MSKSQLPTLDQRARAFKGSFRGVQTEGGDSVHNRIVSFDSYLAIGHVVA